MPSPRSSSRPKFSKVVVAQGAVAAVAAAASATIVVVVAALATVVAPLAMTTRHLPPDRMGPARKRRQYPQQPGRWLR